MSSTEDSVSWDTVHGWINEVLDIAGNRWPCAVMGGAIRDGLNRLMPKDIDLFVDISADINLGIHDVPTCRALVDRAFGMRVRWLPPAATEYGSMRASVKAIGTVLVDGVEPVVNIVLVDTTDLVLMGPPPWQVPEHLQDFAGLNLLMGTNDFGFCQAMMFKLPNDAAPRCLSTLGFREDMLNHQITLRNCEDATQYARSVRRLNRFRKRYDGWMTWVTLSVHDNLMLQGLDTGADFNLLESDPILENTP